MLRTHTVYSYAATEFRPLHDRILIRLEPRKKEDGLIITMQTEHSEVQMAAKVIAVGSDVREVRAGDTVACIHDVLSDHMYKFGDDQATYEAIREKDVLGVVEP